MWLVDAIRFFFLFTTTPPPEIYTLSLHDALPISRSPAAQPPGLALRARLPRRPASPARAGRRARAGDRKSTRLNSSHVAISYAVFCLKKKKNLLSEGGPCPSA